MPTVNSKTCRLRTILSFFRRTIQKRVSTLQDIRQNMQSSKVATTGFNMFQRHQVKGPTHAELSTFLETFLPPSLNPDTQAREVSYLYHTVRNAYYSPTTQLVSRAVFSITPTLGVYTALSATSPRHKTPVCFLHRPFNLDRRSVRRGALVLASHKSFDEHLTVGFNTALGHRLGLELTTAICLRGYKGDDQRKIGLVARLSKPVPLENLVQNLKVEFTGAGDLFRAGKVIDTSDTATTPDAGEVSIDVIAIMNAFHAEEVQRVLVASQEAGWIDNIGDGRKILYLTGAAREYGIEAIAKVEMAAFCVGHVACEEWGIRYLAQQTRNRFPGLDVVEVFEEEERIPRQKTGKEEDRKTDQRGDALEHLDDQVSQHSHS